MLFFIIAVLCFTALFLLLKYRKLNYLISNILKQLSEKEELHIITTELSDKKIERLVYEINKRIREKKQMEYEKKKSEAEIRNNISDISHDMRTPMTSILGYLQLLERSELNCEQQNNLSVALSKTRFLRTLLDDFFELSKLEADNQKFSLSSLDLCAVICEKILEHHLEFNEKRIIPKFTQSDSIISIQAEAHALDRILENLIINLIRYAKSEICIQIEVKDSVILQIKNDFIDSDELDIGHIFDKFYKSSHSRLGSGTGIGLSIAKILMEKLDGSIHAAIEENWLVMELIFKKA